jgi:hypothetical protein
MPLPAIQKDSQNSDQRPHYVAGSLLINRFLSPEEGLLAVDSSAKIPRCRELIAGTRDANFKELGQTLSRLCIW